MQDSEVKKEEEKKVPEKTSIEWHDYVMSHFQPDELFEGNPKVDGLFRITEKLLGPITEVYSTVVEAASERNGYCATVQCQISIEREGKTFPERYSGVGDCSLRNADSTYSKFPSSLAETRAKARALRTALRLRNTVAAEELMPIEGKDETEEFIKDEQITIIDTLCSKMNINVVEVINHVAKVNNYVVRTVSGMHKHIAGKIIRLLNSYQDDRTKIEPTFIGYKKEWRK